MRTTALLVLVLLGLAAGLLQAHAGEAETIAAIAAALDNAFERQSAEEIKRMMTADHIAVTPYYGAPQSVDEQTAMVRQDGQWKERFYQITAVQP